MQTLQLQLPDQLALQVEKTVQSGSFADKRDVILAVLRDFVTRGSFKLIEEQQLKDIA
jgi:Arc/MetJ-type ribon-helix-helix transcriptional regulator